MCQVVTTIKKKLNLALQLVDHECYLHKLFSKYTTIILKSFCKQNVLSDIGDYPGILHKNMKNTNCKKQQQQIKAIIRIYLV